MPSNIPKYNLGIALSGGGAKGFAHLGVLQALKEEGIYPEIIAGTSAGALAGVLIADGYEPADVVSLFKQKAFKEFGQITVPKAGLFKTRPFYKFMEKHLKARSFDELKIPFVAIATDIEYGKSQAFREGEIIPCVIASCSFPIVFEPVNIDGRYYVDGGLFKNFPVSEIRKECKNIIGVNVSPINLVGYKRSLKYMIERSYHYLSASNTMLDRSLSDYLIEIKDLNEYPMFDLEHVSNIFEVGYNYTKQFIANHEDDMERDLLLL